MADLFRRRAFGPPPLALRLAAMLAVPLLLAALYATSQKAIEHYTLNQQADALAQDVRSLRQENLRLQGELERARSDTAIETIARQQLGLVKPGDTAVIVLPPPGRAPASAGATQRPVKPPEPPAWQQWQELFFGPSR